MMKIYYTQFSVPFDDKKRIAYFKEMPVDIQQRIQRYRKEENKSQLLLGRLLLQYGMKEFGYTDFRLTDIYYNENNCPQWKEGVHFNIAHSGNIVACAFSKKNKIGIDIEAIRKIQLKDFAYVLNDIDHLNIAAANPYQAFFKIWTIKEAVTKAIGLGLAIDVQKITVLKDYAIYENKKWFYKKLNFDNSFMGYLVSNENNFDDLEICSVKF